jgi:hypothetical protein
MVRESPVSPPTPTLDVNKTNPPHVVKAVE